MELTTTYFHKPGPGNTAAVLDLAARRVEALNLPRVVVASYTGETGVAAVTAFPGREVVVVAGVYGFKEPNTVRMTDANRAAIESAGGKVLFAGHAFGMLGRAVHRKLGAVQVDEIIAHVLRVFGQGVKVAAEITCMAADAGLVPAGEEVLAIAGSGRGADTAVILRASNTHTFFETRVLEILCKPRG